MLTKNTRHTHKHSQTYSVVVTVRKAYLMIEKYQFFGILEKKTIFWMFLKLFVRKAAPNFQCFTFCIVCKYKNC